MLIVPLMVLAVVSSGYRMQRILAFTDPWADRFGSGYQLVQSEIAFGAGGLTGAGLGQGIQKLFYLPESFTDFISAVIGEELGLIGTLSLITVFCILSWRGLKIARDADKPFNRYLVLGCILLLVSAFIINLGAAMGIFPTKGMPMPFVSYGGSALIGACMLLGFIFSVQRHQRAVASNTRSKRKDRVAKASGMNGQEAAA
jgi:cell division protein FtsW